MTQPYLTADLLVQVGHEIASDAYGTAVTPTSKLRGVSECNLVPIIELERIPEIMGTLQPGYMTVVTAKSGSVTLNGYLLYEDAPYLLDALFGEATPTTDAASDYTYAYTAPTHASDVSGSDTQPRVQTIVYTDMTNTKSLSGAYLTGLVVSGAVGGALTYNATYLGKTFASDVHAPAMDAADRTVVIVMGDHVSMWIDPGSDAVATTPVSDIAWNFELTVNPNRTPVKHLGELTPTGFKDGPWSGTLALTCEYNSTTKAYVTAILAATATPIQKNVRIKGVSSATKYVQFDFGGYLETPPRIWEDHEGVLMVTLTIVGEYTSGLTNWLAAECKNTIASMP